MAICVISQKKGQRNIQTTPLQSLFIYCFWDVFIREKEEFYGHKLDAISMAFLMMLFKLGLLITPSWMNTPLSFEQF